MKAKAYVAILAVLAFVGGALLAGNRVFYTPGVYGPYSCGNACTGGYPNPDPGTRAYITTMNQYLIAGGEFINMSGDQFIVCNDSYCITYTRTSDGGFLGTNVQPQSNYGGGGGGEGTGGAGAGGGGGGGCVASCGTGSGSAGTGTVTIGDDEKLPPKQDP